MLSPRTWAIGMWLALAASALTYGCAPKPSQELFAQTDAQMMKLRALQTRTFDVKDRRAALRAIIAGLQDLGFIIERASEPLGFVTAERFAEPNFYTIVGVTVTIHSQEDGRLVIRANAIHNRRPIEDPKVYQNFFAALQRSLFSTQESRP